MPETIIHEEVILGGKAVQSEKYWSVTSPHSGKEIARVPELSSEQTSMAIQRAYDTKDIVAKMPAYKRSEILTHVASRVREEKRSLAELISLENGKPLKYSLGEVDRCIITLETAAREALNLPHELMDLDVGPTGKDKEALFKYRPAGVVLGITPFNFPLNTVAHKMAPAIAVGCPILLKPSDKTPLSTLRLADYVRETEWPADAIATLTCDIPTTRRLMEDERIAAVSFTGSPVVGWELKAMAGHKKVLLELGGNCGCIICEDYDPEQSVDRLMLGAFAYSGQVCIHTQRIYVHRSQYQKTLDVMVERAAALRVGDPLDEHTDISQMITDEAAQRVKEWIDEAVANGAQLVSGGNRQGRMVSPTILTQTDESMKVCNLEVFGPVVSIEPFDELDEAINRVNQGPYGLQAGIFTYDVRKAERAFDRIEVGGLVWNDVPTFRMDHMPYGGVKTSGFGREGIRYTMLEYCEPKLLIKPKYY